MLLILESGGGYVFFDDVSAGYFNLGLGVEYVLGEKKKMVLFAKSLFRNTGENYGNKHFQHSIGLGFRFGAEKDRDEDGIFDKDDTCPDTPGLAEFNGCPDTDGDGIQDAEDSCPEEADLAAFNGCPDSDNDGVQDSLDECPDIVGTPANSGCPEISETIIEQLNEIGQTIYFPTNSSELNDNTKRIVDQVYDIIIAYPNYRIEVQGHTDNIGRDDANMRLSETRAISVSNYLISKGIPESRIYAKGYGETSPAESNVTARGRALNRRVEFNLISD